MVESQIRRASVIRVSAYIWNRPMFRRGNTTLCTLRHFDDHGGPLGEAEGREISALDPELMCIVSVSVSAGHTLFRQQNFSYDGAPRASIRRVVHVLVYVEPRSPRITSNSIRIAQPSLCGTPIH